MIMIMDIKAILKKNIGNIMAVTFVVAGKRITRKYLYCCYFDFTKPFRLEIMSLLLFCTFDLFCCTVGVSSLC